MKVEEGKYYKLDNGDKVYVSEFRGGTGYWPFAAMYDKSNTGVLYIKEDGTTTSGFGGYNTPNLVEEWEEEKMFKVGDKVQFQRKGEGVWREDIFVVQNHHPRNYTKQGDLIGVSYDKDGNYNGWLGLDNEDCDYRLYEEPKEVPTNEQSGRVTVDITDRIDEIIRGDLEWSALQMLKEDNDKHEFIGNKAQLFGAFCKVIEYYSTPKQWEEFVVKTKGKKVE